MTRPVQSVARRTGVREVGEEVIRGRDSVKKEGKEARSGGRGR